MSVGQWFADNVFLAIREFDKGKLAFCDESERAQVKTLRDHFRQLPTTMESKVEVPYVKMPRSPADLLVVTTGRDRMTCELKGMYKTWFKANCRPYPAYLWSPFRNPSKKDSAGHDLWRLANFTGPDTTHIVQIIIGSSLPVDRLADDLNDYARLAQIVDPPWACYQSRWINPHYADYEYDIRVWVCEWLLISNWRERMRKHFE